MKSRFFFFSGLLILAFGILIFRLFTLTVIQGERNRILAEEQRIKIRKITAPRGMIFDRKGKPLVRNVPIFKKCSTEKGGANVGCQVITREEALRLEAQNRDADLVVDIGREYFYGETMAHLLGYLGEISKEEIKNPAINYKLGDLVGRTGIEEEYEDILRGIDGGELVEVDTHGVTKRKIGKRQPIPGKDITLSIDASLQQVAYQALKGRKGAVVVQDRDGQILALVSSPSFNPNNLTEEVLNDKNYPLFNRAVSGVYPPGSTFKIITAVAGLEEGKIDGQTKIEDPGVIEIGKYKYANWYFTQYGKTEGKIDLVRAIKRSTDTFFYKVGEFVGATKLVSWGKSFGLGQVLGIDIPGEVSGFLPDPSSGGWFLGNTYHLSIGQGNLGLTPLQVNVMTGVIASGGRLCRPQIGAKGLPVGKAGREGERVGDCRDVSLKPETIRLITEGMKEACSPGGTAFPLFNFQPQVACKTGTAEFDDPAGRTHAWLTAFAPSPDGSGQAPEIVVTALVEAGGEGSRVAAPIVKEVLEEYFRQ